MKKINTAAIKMLNALIQSENEIVAELSLGILSGTVDLDDYVPGGFMERILDGDVEGAYTAADLQNKQALMKAGAPPRRTSGNSHNPKELSPVRGNQTNCLIRIYRSKLSIHVPTIIGEGYGVGPGHLFVRIGDRLFMASPDNEDNSHEDYFTEVKISLSDSIELFISINLELFDEPKDRRGPVPNPTLQIPFIQVKQLIHDAYNADYPVNFNDYFKTVESKIRQYGI